MKLTKAQKSLDIRDISSNSFYIKNTIGEE